MRLLIALSLALVACVFAAPVDLSLQNELKSLQDQIAQVQRELKSESSNMAYSNLDALPPQKRMVAWQPMKRVAVDEREPLIRAIEGRLSEILRAGEKLGVSPDEEIPFLY
ncbi:unnamed protein product, partial [Mesorhabditis belari]|uniref:Uncharacterized protein n=1 Tax=Mesorhabditis belari TaxID=2138241 RepID=A0AAF3EG04_9BILA